MRLRRTGGRDGRTVARALSAGRALQPSDQRDDADDRSGDPDFDSTVPIERAEHVALRSSSAPR